MTNEQKQCLLTFLGYNCGEIDGKFGAKSKAATKDFQREYGGLAVDGSAGANTQKAMRKAVSDGWERPKTGDWWEEIQYFRPAEFGCKCGACGLSGREMSEKLLHIADRIRGQFGASVQVSSGLRCRRHNAEVGGVAGSRHLCGKAMDFCVSGKSAGEVLAAVKKQPEIRYTYAIDSRYVHMDVE